MFLAFIQTHPFYHFNCLLIGEQNTNGGNQLGYFVSNIVVSTDPADGLAAIRVRASTGTVVTRVILLEWMNVA